VETFCGWFHDGYEVVDIERGIQQAKDSFAQQGKPLYAAGGATASIEAIAHSMKEVRVGRGPK